MYTHVRTCRTTCTVRYGMNKSVAGERNAVKIINYCQKKKTKGKKRGPGNVIRLLRFLGISLYFFSRSDGRPEEEEKKNVEFRPKRD